MVLAGLTGPVKWLFGAIFGAIYAPFVITGLHHMTNAIDLELVRTAGGTGLWPMIALSNIAQGSAVFAYYFIKRHDEREAQISLPATISAYLGVTEPALFGVNVKYVYPLVAGMSASACQDCSQQSLEFKQTLLVSVVFQLFSQLNLNIGQSLRLL